ncbi:MAG: sodium:proton antiporter NhaD [Patescibacteria group bacterium]
MITILSVTIFLLGYIAISQEHLLKISKTSISLIIAVLLWSLVVVGRGNNIGVALAESAGEIFGLVIFLLSAMTLVEILTHYGLFDYVYTRLLRLKIDDKAQFFIITFLSFIFSAFLDNLTTTIVFLQIAGRFFSGKNLLRSAAAIVIAANAGGAFSPIGDVTTTMLWLANKFTIQTVVTQAFIPSMTVFLYSSFLIGKSITVDTKDRVEKAVQLGKIEWFIIGLCLLSFLLPLFMTVLHLPPYFGLLFGLGIIWLAVDLLRLQASDRTSLSVSIEKFFQKTDISSLYFFIGILLAVGALRHLGVLDEISHKVFTTTPTTARIIAGNISIGGLSAVFDNIPLTAAAIDILKTTDPSLWVLLALTVGVGGSLLLIGSAPGIIAMTIVKELTSTAYLKIATLPALVAFLLGIAVWFLQYNYLR